MSKIAQKKFLDKVLKLQNFGFGQIFGKNIKKLQKFGFWIKILKIFDNLNIFNLQKLQKLIILQKLQIVGSSLRCGEV